MFVDNVIDHEFPSSHGREKAPTQKGARQEEKSQARRFNSVLANRPIVLPSISRGALT